MYGYPNIINSRADLDNLLADDTYRAQALAHLQTLMDEQYGYDAAGVWSLVGGGGLARLGISRAEAAALGALDRVVSEPARIVDLAAAKAAACAALDAQAEALRLTVLTPGAGQMAAYQAKETQATAFLQDGTPTEVEYPDIFNEIGITADSAAEVAAAILAAAEKWRLFGRVVERTRLAGKKAVQAATDMAGIIAARDGVAWPEASSGMP
jgi:hypothetical protein